MVRMLRALVLVVMAVALIGALLWPPAAWGVSGQGERLFDIHCAGCHPNGGNVVRRGRTLKQPALRRNGIEGPEDIARIAAAGIGRMDGYGDGLGESGADAVGRWVWQQALAGWPRG